jgi:4-alpha-glucanotransferase
VKVADTRTRGLHSLAHLYGVQTAYYDVERQRRGASAEVLLRVLQALGAPLETLADVPAALKERRAAPWLRGVEPVVVAWQGQRTQFELRRPGAEAETRVVCCLALENGDRREWSAAGGDVTPIADEMAGGRRYVAQRLPLPSDVPVGYHRLHVDASGREFEALVIAAPRRAYTPFGTDGDAAAWGAFLPLYALRTADDWGVGDFGDLESLASWVASLGGSFVATLPLLAAFLDMPFEPSPYSPASRLFWNELFVDLERAPELQHCPAAQRRLASPETCAERQALREAPLVEYERVAALKGAVLRELARCFFAEGEAPAPGYQQWVAGNPRADDYAAFRAACRHFDAGWSAWPEGPREGRLAAGDFDPEVKRYYLYAQWLADQQLEGLARRTQDRGARLYLDLPLGVNPDSYDVWREREAFALGVSAGTP